MLIGGREVGEILVEDHRVPIVSATGSTAMGRQVGPQPRGALRPRHPRARRQQRGDRRAFRRSRPRAARHRLLRHGHRGPALHDACGACSSTTASTTGSCRSCKRVYASVRIGDPRAEGTLVGPLIDRAAFEGMERALEEAARPRAAGPRRRARRPRARERRLLRPPALVEMPAQTGPVLRETFAPILYVMRYCDAR